MPKSGFGIRHVLAKLLGKFERAASSPLIPSTRYARRHLPPRGEKAKFCHLLSTLSPCGRGCRANARRDEGFFASSLDLPTRRAVLVVLDRHAHGIEFVADAVRLFPVLCSAAARRASIKCIQLSLHRVSSTLAMVMPNKSIERRLRLIAHSQVASSCWPMRSIWSAKLDRVQ